MSDKSPERYVVVQMREAETADPVTDSKETPSQALHLFALAQSLNLNNQLPSRTLLLIHFCVFLFFVLLLI